MGKNDEGFSYTNRVAAAWKREARRPPFWVELAVTLIAFVIFLLVNLHFSDYVEARPGVELPDPILRLFSPVDVTWYVFAVLWFSTVLGMACLAPEPECILMVIQAFTLHNAFRVATLFLTPLEAPPGTIPLTDPLVELTATGETLTKDLFFSGHAAAMFLLFLSAKKRWLKPVFLMSTLVVSLLVVLQYVHYVVDVLVAPFMAYGSWRIIVLCHERFDPQP